MNSTINLPATEQNNSETLQIDQCNTLEILELISPFRWLFPESLATLPQQ